MRDSLAAVLAALGLPPNASNEEAARALTQALMHIDPLAFVGRQDIYAALHAWALRGMGYGIGDHPETSGERHVLDLLAKRCDRPVVFDVGANVGVWAQSALERFDVGWVHCFEPSPSAYASLIARMTSRTAVWPQTYSHAYGLSDAECDDHIYTDTPGSGMASVYPRQLEHFGRELGLQERVRLRRLDDVCAELGVPRIDLLKLDVEGHELAVLRGAGSMLETGAIRMIQFEFGGCNLDSRTTWQDFWYLLSPRYDLLRVVADGLVPIERYREQDEIYICSNFVAVWREP